MLAFDTETHLIGPGQLAPRWVCVTWAIPDDRAYRYGIMARQPGREDRADVWQWSTFFGQEGVTTKEEAIVNPEDFLDDMLQQGLVVGHNVAFDLGVLMAGFPRLVPRVFAAMEQDRIRDTMIREMLIAIAKDRFRFDPDLKAVPRFSLAERGALRCNLSLSKGEDTYRLRYAELDGVALSDWPDEAVRYATLDAVATMKVWLAIEKAVPKDEWLQVRSALAMHLMSCWGMVTDQAAVAQLQEALQDDIAARLGELVEAGLVSPEGKKSIKRVQDRVTQAYGGNPPRNEVTEKAAAKGVDLGNIKYDGETLESSGDPVLVGLALYETRKKVLNDFCSKLTPLVQPRFNVLVSSGRTSCSNPNLQQIPRTLDLNPEHWKGALPGRDVRGCFVPRPGWKFLDADFSAIEICTLAEICHVELGYSSLGDLLRKGVDPHLHMAQKILCLDGLDLPYADLKRIAKDKADPLHRRVKDARQLSKAANFGFPGGLGPDTFIEYAWASWGVRISRDAAADLKLTWLNEFPEMREYFKLAGESDGVYVQHLSERVRAGLDYCSYCNTKFQGLAADLAKHGNYELVRECFMPPDWRSPEYEMQWAVPGRTNALSGCRVVLFMHDQNIVEAPGSWDLVPGFEDAGSRWGADTPDVLAYGQMVHVMKTWAEKWVKSVPIKIEGKISDCWEKD